MAFSQGKESSLCLDDILKKTTEGEILAYYLGITNVPTLIGSPLRQDNNPSFGIYSPDGVSINYIDFATKEGGRIYGLLGKMWNKSFQEVLHTIDNDLNSHLLDINIKKISPKIRSSKECNNSSDLQCKIREWEDYDLEYWREFGIELPWLKYAEIYPISHIISIRDNQRFVFRADKLAYAYVEHKDNKVTLKIYQPLNKKGFKWRNKHDKSVISLWTKVPEYGDKICICSSLKDALCLWSNTGIPAIAIQGEGYPISNTAISELKRRYKDIYILLDNDEAGLYDAKKLAEDTGFKNIVLPEFEGGKDISDYYKILQNKELFKQSILNLF